MLPPRSEMSTKPIETVAFIVQARLASERLPRKMLKPFAGSTLLDVMLSKIKHSSRIPRDQFYLAVHEAELCEVGRRYGLEIFHRSQRSMRSEGRPIKELYEWWDQIPYEHVVLISACAPLLSIETIDRFIDAFLASEHEGLFAVVEKRNYFFSADRRLTSEPPPFDSVMNTKFVSPLYQAAHCLYAGNLAAIGQGRWMGNFSAEDDPALFVVSEEEAFDIDFELDFQIAESIFTARMPQPLLRQCSS